MRAACYQIRAIPTRFLRRFSKLFQGRNGASETSVDANTAFQLALHGLSCFGIVLVAPDNQLKHGADFRASLQSGPDTTGGGPIFLFGGGGFFRIGTDVAITIQDVKGHAAVVETI